MKSASQEEAVCSLRDQLSGLEQEVRLVNTEKEALLTKLQAAEANQQVCQGHTNELCRALLFNPPLILFDYYSHSSDKVMSMLVCLFMQIKLWFSIIYD